MRRQGRSSVVTRSTLQSFDSEGEIDRKHSQSADLFPLLMRTVFIQSTLVVLLVTALAKLASAFGSAEVLTLPDPLLGWDNRSTLLAGALVESLVIAVLARRSAPSVKLCAIFALCLILLAFRFCRWLMNAPSPCPCMGNMYAIIRLTPRATDSIAKILLTYMLSGSSIFLLLAFSAGVRGKIVEHRLTPAANDPIGES